jgi:acetyl-CoA carboxylase alpha subunit
MWNRFTYFFKRKYQQIQRVIDFLPIIWKGFDFDYIYSIELFKKQLERQASFLESERALTLEAHNNAKKIRTALRLMDIVYDEKYIDEVFTELTELYGESKFGGEKLYTLKITNQNAVNEIHQEKINEERSEKIKLARIKQKRAHKLLWDYIEHNIQNWWD